MIALSCSELARVGPPRPSGPPTLIARMVSRGSILRSHVSGVCLLTAYNKDKTREALEVSTRVPLLQRFKETLHLAILHFNRL